METQANTLSPADLVRRTAIVEGDKGRYERDLMNSVGVCLKNAKSFHDVLGRMGVPRIRTVDIQTVDGLPCPGRKAVATLGDNPTVVGHVSDQWKIVQPADAIRPVAKAVADSKGSPRALKLNRGGIVDDGRIIWLKASMATGRPVGDLKIGDTVRCDLSLRIVNDGSGSVSVDISPKAIRCWNSLVAATARARTTVQHRGDVQGQMTAFGDAIDVAWREWANTLRVYNELAEGHVPGQIRTRAATGTGHTTAPVSMAELIRTYTAAVFGRSELERQVANGGNSRRSNALIDAYMNGHGGKPGERTTCDGTGWGLYQALTDYLTHGRTMNDARHMSLTAGSAAGQSRRGIEVAHAMTCGRVWTLEDLLDPQSEVMRESRAALAA